MPRIFNRETGFGEIVANWWADLEEDPASRAILRRAPSLTAIVMSPAYQWLYRRLRKAGWRGKANSDRDDHLAAVAGLLAHVRRDDRRTFPNAASRKPRNENVKVTERPPVSELRFVRLLESPDIDTLFVGLRRALPLIDHAIDVVEFANDVVSWDDTVKRRWAYEYEWPGKSK